MYHKACMKSRQGKDLFQSAFIEDYMSFCEMMQMSYTCFYTYWIAHKSIFASEQIIVGKSMIYVNSDWQQPFLGYLNT